MLLTVCGWQTLCVAQDNTVWAPELVSWKNDLAIGHLKHACVICFWPAQSTTAGHTGRETHADQIDMHDKEMYAWQMGRYMHEKWPNFTVMWHVQLSLYISFLADITSSPLRNFGIITFAFTKFSYCEILEETKSRPMLQFAFILWLLE